MIAAVYARKSTEQIGVSDCQKSVARQLDHARQYAARKGWAVADAYVYVDDGISGAEFANRPGFLRLMNALKPRAPFQVLIMSEESRLGREAIETAYALKQLITAGVRVFFYLEDRERTLDSPTDKIMMSLTAFADELEREKARQRTADAMQRKARAGHVTGGRVFGYDNVPVMLTGTDGQPRRSHVERVINDREAAVVRQIFELTAQGRGKTAIAKLLNDRGELAPRAQQHRPRSWASSSIQEILHRPLYRGEVVYNRTRKRNPWGQHQQTARPEQEWIRTAAPALRIVPDALWTAAHRYLMDARVKYLRGTDGRLWGRQSRSDSKYLLPGFARCASCNGVMHVRSRSHGQQRVYFYGCTSYWKRGRSVCQNNLEVRMTTIDDDVLQKIADQVLDPGIIEEIVARTLAAQSACNPAHEAEQRAAELQALDAEIARYVAAIGVGGEMSELVTAIQVRRTRRTELVKVMARLARQGEQQANLGSLEQEIRGRVEQWRALMSRHASQARQLLRKMLKGRPILFEPTEENGVRGYRFRGQASVSDLLAGLVSLPLTVASPTGSVNVCNLRFAGVAA